MSEVRLRSSIQSEVRLLPIRDRGKLSPHSFRPMAIIIDSSISKGQGGTGRQPSPPPPQPPPPYAESATTQPPVVQSGISGVPHGPTPIDQTLIQQATLPYYDPRSVHSVQAAKRRAKERFVGAALWVLLIFALVSLVIWVDVRP